MNSLYPIFVKLDQLRLLIIGGGEAASEKLRYILKSSPNANVTLISREVSDEITELGRLHPQVKIFLKEFQSSDLFGKDIAIIATDDREFNSGTRDEAKRHGILVNVSDTPELCDFYLGSIVTKGDLKIAISTNGKSPTFAKRLRELFEEIIPDDINTLLDNLSTFRSRLNGSFREKVQKLNELTESLIKN